MNIYIYISSRPSGARLSLSLTQPGGTSHFGDEGDRKKLGLVDLGTSPLSSALFEMGRKRKNRTHVKTVPGASDNTPKSFVIKHGQVGRSLSQLVHDMRKVMEPNTASKLRVSRLSLSLRSP